MIAPTAIALSGVLAQSDRVAMAASNLANQRSIGALPAADGSIPAGQPAAYQAGTVGTTAQAAGGVSAFSRPLTTPIIPEYQPDARFANDQGMVGAPNVDAGQQLLTMMSASTAYKTNLAVLRTTDDMTREVLRMKA